MKLYNKLIRDKIPHIIEAEGKLADCKVLSDDDYKKMLDSKLGEELNEYLSANEDEQVAELADLVEVIYGILASKGVSVEEFEKVRLAKLEDRGGFKEKLLLVSIE